jgi:hypothetical protein
VTHAGAAGRAVPVMAAFVPADPAVAVPFEAVTIEYAVPPGTGGWHDEVALVGVCGAGQGRLPAISPHLPDDVDDPASGEHSEEDHEPYAAGHRPPPFASRQTERKRVSPRVYRPDSRDSPAGYPPSTWVVRTSAGPKASAGWAECRIPLLRRGSPYSSFTRLIALLASASGTDVTLSN